MFSPYDLPNNIVLLITDELASPADFFLHSRVGSRLKESKSYRSLVVSTMPDISRWKAIGSKSHNLNMDDKLSLGALSFIDVFSTIQPQSDVGEVPQLVPLYQAISAALSNSSEASNTDVILDGISSLHWMGSKPLDIIRFFRAVRALCMQLGCSLFIRHHMITPSEPDEIFRLLFQLCSYHLDIRPLSSGKSGAVSGEIALHPGPNAQDQVLKPIPRSSALQFRLTDYSALFFEKGTAGGIL